MNLQPIAQLKLTITTKGGAVLSETHPYHEDSKLTVTEGDVRVLRLQRPGCFTIMRECVKADETMVLEFV